MFQWGSGRDVSRGGVNEGVVVLLVRSESKEGVRRVSGAVRAFQESVVEGRSREITGDDEAAAVVVVMLGVVGVGWWVVGIRGDGGGLWCEGEVGNHQGIPLQI